MRSMTGFGEAVGENGRHAIMISVRSVNHRFLDLQLRLSEELRGSEPDLRELLQRHLLRGRIEARVEVRPLFEREAAVEVRLEVVRAVHTAARRLADAGLVEGPALTVSDLLRLPDTLRVVLAADAWDERDRELLLRVAGEAVGRLVAARELEGRSLGAALEERLAGLDAAVELLAARRGAAREEAAEALRRRVAELMPGGPGGWLDEARLAQEIAILADRSDVSEELDRLQAHLAHFRTASREAGALGKRLDFLVQEIFRELNTLGAKCRDAAMTRSVLDAKLLCEQLREQVQNVE